MFQLVDCAQRMKIIFFDSEFHTRRPYDSIKRRIIIFSDVTWKSLSSNELRIICLLTQLSRIIYLLATARYECQTKVVVIKLYAERMWQKARSAQLRFSKRCQCTAQVSNSFSHSGRKITATSRRGSS